MSVEDENKRKREEKGREMQKSIKIKIKINHWEMLIILVQIATVDFSKLDMKLLF